MNTRELREHFLSRSPWVDPEHTVDTIKAGDPDKPIQTVGVTWFPAMETLREAVRLGCDALIVHEPTFWEHAAPESHWRTRGPGIEKQRFLEETGLVVLRIHDVWDKWPGIGIRPSWAKGLGLGEPVYVDDTEFRAIYAIEPQPLKQFAQTILEKIRPLGEDSVQVMGDPDLIISRPSLGVGCIIPEQHLVEEGSDCFVCCFDGAGYWNARERFVESGIGVITVEHGTTEMWGLESLARYVDETFPDLTVHYIDRHPKTWTVKA